MGKKSVKRPVGHLSARVRAGMNHLKTKGFAYTWWKVRTGGTDARRLQIWMRKHRYTRRELRKQAR